MFDDILVGMVFGVLIAGGMAAALHERGLEDCERNLPRTQKCEKVWQPKPESSKQQSKHGGVM